MIDVAFQYAKRGFNRKLLSLLEDTPGLVAQTLHGETLLLTAVRHEHTNVFDILFGFPRVKETVNLRGADGMTPLMVAARNDDAHMINVLLAHGAKKTVRFPDSKMKPFDNAVAGKRLTAAHALNAQDAVVRDRLRLSRGSYRDCAGHTAMVQRLHREFLNGRHDAVAIASLAVSHMILSVVGDVAVYASLGVPEDQLAVVRAFKRMPLGALERTFAPQIRAIANERGISEFKKDIQWPHLPLVFASSKRGSCVDLLLIKLTLYELRAIEYNFGIFEGKNTLLSHAEVFDHTDSKATNRSLMFVVFSLYHTFRALQVCRYALKDAKREAKILSCMRGIIGSIVPNKFVQTRILKFIMTRNRATYDACVRLYKKKQVRAPRGKIYTRLPRDVRKRVVKTLKESFPGSIGGWDMPNINRFVFDRDGIENRVWYSNDGLCVFRPILEKDAKRLQAAYNLKAAPSGIYIAYIVKTNKSIGGFASHVFSEIQAKRAGDLLLEVRRSNARAILVYESLGFTRAASSETQHLYILKNGRLVV